MTGKLLEVGTFTEVASCQDLEYLGIKTLELHLFISIGFGSASSVQVLTTR